jgi:integrase
VNRPRHKQAKGKGKGRGKRTETDLKRAPRSVNRELRAIKTILEHLRRLGLVPLVTRDALADNLELVPEPRPVPAFLRPAVLVKLIDAAQRHDGKTFRLTRNEKAKGLAEGETPRFPPVLPYLSVVLLSGMRAAEARLLRWDAVDLTAEPTGTIELKPDDVKTKHGRLIDLIVSEILRELLRVLRLRAGDDLYVFQSSEPANDESPLPVTYASLEAARKRLIKLCGAPRFSWQRLRVTCGTFLANAPGIFGAASAYREAKQLGHSVAVAEKHYLGVVHVAPEAKTLEAAMGIEAVLRSALELPAKAKHAPATQEAE